MARGRPRTEAAVRAAVVMVVMTMGNCPAYYGSAYAQRYCALRG